MHHAADGRQLGLKVGHEPFDVLGVGHIAALDDDLGVVLLGVGDGLGHGGRHLAGARDEHDVLGAAAHHPLGQAAADAAGAADEHIGGVGPQGAVEGALRVRGLDLVVGPGRDQDLAVGLAGLQRAEGGLDVGDGEDGDGLDGPDLAEGEQLEDVVEDALHLLRTLGGDDGQIHRGKGGVVLEDGHLQARVGQDVALADLDEAAKVRHALPRGAQRVAGQRVEHHVDAAAAGGAQDALGKGRVAAEEDVVLGQAVRVDEELLLVRAADGGVDLGADHLAEHDGGLADAAGGGVDEYRLAALQAADVEEAVVGRGEDDGHGGGRLEAHVVGHARGAGGLAARVGGVGALGAGADPVADLEVGDGAADGVDHAGALDAQVRAGHLAHGHHDVLEVHRRDLDLNGDLVGRQRRGRDRVVDEVQRVQGALGADVQLQRPPRLREGL